MDAPIVERLPKTGDAETAVIITELTLEYGNENAAASFVNFAVGGQGGL